MQEISFAAGAASVHREDLKVGQASTGASKVANGAAWLVSAAAPTTVRISASWFAAHIARSPSLTLRWIPEGCWCARRHRPSRPPVRGDAEQVRGWPRAWRIRVWSARARSQGAGANRMAPSCCSNARRVRARVKAAGSVRPRASPKADRAITRAAAPARRR